MMEKGDGENPTRINKYACACAIVASMISIIFGYDTGVMSGAMIFVKEEFKINDAKTEVLAGILNLCALVGSLCAGRTSDYIGRRYTIVIASLIFLCGSVIMGYGPSYPILLLGRCVAGLGVGFALMIAPVYSAEVSSPSSRGFLTSLPEVGISTAITTGGAFFLFAGISVVALIFFYFFLPETKGKSLEEMEAVFTRGRRTENVNREVEIVKK